MEDRYRWFGTIRRSYSTPCYSMFALVLATALLLVTWQFATPAAGQEKPEVGLESIAVFVDRAPSSESPGCGSISLFDIDAAEALYRHPYDGVGVFDLDVDADARQIVASPLGGFGGVFVHMRWLRTGPGWDTWQTRRADEPRELHLSRPWAGVTFIPGTATLLAPIHQSRLLLASFDSEAFETVVRPDRDEKLVFPWPEGHVPLPGSAPIKIIVGRDGRIAHTLDRFGNLATIDLHAFEPAAPPMMVPGFVPDEALAPRAASAIGFADISVDERYLVTNRWNAPELGVTDLQTRISRTVAAGEGITMTGDVAFNHGWENPGLLAVHALSHVVVYRFHPDGPLEELARHPVHAVNFGGSAVPAAIAWSASGDRLIAATNNGPNDFVIFSVLDCGRRLIQVAEIAACANDRNQGFGIWTANKRLSPPEDFVPRCQLPELRPTATPPPPPVPSPTPFATPLFDDPIRYPEQRMTEEGVIVLEGSTNEAVPGCGGLTYFATSVGDPKGRLSGLGEPGRIAHGWGLGDFVIGPVDADRPTYRAVNRVHYTEHGSTWHHEELSPTFGVPLPFAAMTRVWADAHVLLTYRDRSTDAVTMGLFDLLTVGSPVPDAPFASAVVPHGVPAAVVLEAYYGEDAMTRWGGTGWVVTDSGDVWRLTLVGMESLTLDGPIASLGSPPAVSDDVHEPAARRVHATLTHDERHILVSRWGRGEIDVVELATGTVRRVPAGDGLTLTGQIATNRAWENGGLIALHAGDHIVVYATDPDDGTPIEIARHPIAPPHDALGNVEPGYVAWGTNGLSLFATTDDGLAEFAAFRVRECGRLLEPLYRVAGCEVPGARNSGRAILTANQGFVTRAEYTPVCPAGVIPPTLTPSPATVTPSPTDEVFATIHLPHASKP